MLNEEMTTAAERLADLKNYLLTKGRKYEDLTEDQLIKWSEVYDKYNSLQTGKTTKPRHHFLSFFISF
jgi:hypothetical protein